MKQQVELGITDHDEREFVKGNGLALAPQSDPTMQMIERAVEQGWDVDRLSKLLDLQQRWQANEARIAFEDAMAAFKTEAVIVTRDKVNKQYDSKYTSLGNLVGTVNPALSKHGLSAAWDVDQSVGVKVTCTLTHRLGHAKSCTITFPPDKSGAKNPLQEIKSALTYGKICTFESVCGLSPSDQSGDDDGNGAGAQQGLSETAVTEFTDSLKGASSREELQRRFQEAYKAATSAKDKKSGDFFIETKNQLMKKLR
jgi:ERF superfamily protein